MNQSLLVLAHLSWNPLRLVELLQRFDSPESLLAAVRKGRVEVTARDRRVASTTPGLLSDKLDELGISLLAREELPAALQMIPDPPAALFVKGSLPQSAGVGVVGSRRASGYGVQLARTFGSALARQDVPVVSGLARGVDAAAHDGVVTAGGVGVAVLGCGLDRWYPRSNERLGEALLERGAVVSEYAPGCEPLPWRFPVRNRIISGLSEAVVVVEAAEKGGALITARTAADQGRLVMAVPGDVDRPTARGANLLIRDGAHPVLDAEDLVAFVSTATGIEVQQTTSEDPLLELIGVGRRPEWLAVETGLPVQQLFVRLGQLEAEGRVVWRNGLVCTA